jgi:hypothetical protein
MRPILSRPLRPRAVLLLLLPAVAAAEPPLHERIDRAVAAARPDFAKVAAGRSSDAEFLRRVTLDLTGTVPTGAAARAFLSDTSLSKRTVLVDRLLANSEHARYLATVFDVMLMERRPDQHVPTPAWRDFLREAVAANRPWDQVVRDILASDGTDPKTRPGAKFFLDRGGEPNLVTRDISRLFFGTNLQCCQCHDHPRVEEYKQEHYYGLYAFVSRSFVFADPKLKLSVLAEKGEGDVTFQSVFDKAKVTKQTGPRIPDGPPVAEPAVEKGKEYIVAPVKDNTVRPVPRVSRRALLGPTLARAENAAFRRNLANRLWAVMMGRGLVHPLDMDHPGNPPSNPELLALLTDDPHIRHFDVRGFLREIALSETYQRSSEPAPSAPTPGPADLTVAPLKPLMPEALGMALMQATGLADAERAALGKDVAEPALYAKLSANLPSFVQAFGGPPGLAQSFDATLDQALFLANGPVVRAWLQPRAGNLTDRLLHLPTADAVAEELYLSVLTRQPDADERHELADYLHSHASDRSTAVQELAWALLTSAEFRFNH